MRWVRVSAFLIGSENSQIDGSLMAILIYSLAGSLAGKSGFRFIRGARRVIGGFGSRLIGGFAHFSEAL